MQLNSKVDAILSCINGSIHTLVIDGTESIENLRMDAFEVKKRRADGAGVAIDYHVLYTQLMP